jgi:predicted DNA-binding mobile mystery protein A
MTTRQLARRMGSVQSRVVALEKAEASGTTTLKSIREAAEALDCRLIYVLLPIKPLDTIIKERAREKAYRQLTEVAHGMLLENQALSQSQAEEELARLTTEILSEPLRLLWDDE